MADWDIATRITPPDHDMGKTISNFNAAHELYQRNLTMRGMQDYRAALDAGEPPESAARHILRVDPALGRSSLEGTQSQRDVTALGNYGRSGNLNDTMGTSPNVQSGVAEAATGRQKVHHEEINRTAYSLLNERDPERRRQQWQQIGDDWVRRGVITREGWQRYRDNPSDDVLNTIIRNTMPVAANMEATGQTAEAAAAGRAPFEAVQTEPGRRIEYPAQRPGGPGSGFTPPPRGQIRGPSPVPNVTVPPAQPIADPTQPIVPTPVPTTSIRPGASAAGATPETPAAPGTGAAATPAPTGSVPSQFGNIPIVPVSPTVSGGPGVVEPGQHPLAMEATKAAMTMINSDIQPAASTSQRQRASLLTMESELRSGRVDSNRLAELRMTIAGFVNGVLREPNAETASRILGTNLPWAEAFNKDATRMGLQYARQTEGAREAVQAIQIALQANPSILNTVGGNLQIIRTMNAAAEYDIQRAHAATDYFRAQQQGTGTGHLFGFDNWFNQTHNPSVFISRAVPFALPPRGESPRPGVTYEIPTGERGSDGQSKSVPRVWNPDTRHFEAPTSR